MRIIRDSGNTTMMTVYVMQVLVRRKANELLCLCMACGGGCSRRRKPKDEECEMDVCGYVGTESLGITAGETKNPSRNMPRVVKFVFWRSGVVYALVSRID